MTWNEDWREATKDTTFPDQHAHKALWQAARAFYYVTGQVVLMDGKRLRAWSWLWRMYVKISGRERRDVT